MMGLITPMMNRGILPIHAKRGLASLATVHQVPAVHMVNAIAKVTKSTDMVEISTFLKETLPVMLRRNFSYQSCSVLFAIMSVMAL